MLAGPFPRGSERLGNLGRSLGLVLDDRALDDCEAAIFFVVRGFVLSDEPPRELLVLHDQRRGLRDRNQLLGMLAAVGLTGCPWTNGEVRLGSRAAVPRTRADCPQHC